MSPAGPRAADEVRALKARLVALSTELESSRRALWVERARRAHPALTDDLVEFLTGADEAEVERQASRLAQHLLNV